MLISTILYKAISNEHITKWANAKEQTMLNGDWKLVKVDDFEHAPLFSKWTIIKKFWFILILFMIMYEWCSGVKLTFFTND